MTQSEQNWRDGASGDRGLDEDTGLDDGAVVIESTTLDDSAPVGGSAPVGNGGGLDRPALLEAGELDSFVARWQEIQAGFVDEPRQAVEYADALVADLMQRLAQTFASQREQLESSWDTGAGVSTEDLRQGLRRYRSLFERLLAA